MIRAEILGTGGYVPARVVPNAHFDYLVDDADQWIHSRTGIRERRFAAAEEATSDLATNAALLALENGDVDPLELDCIIVATSTPDMILPATACMVQKNIGAAKAFAFDMNAVCSSFIYGVELADNLIRSGKYRKVLLIGADTYSKILDMDDKTTAPLFGDGAGALILGAGLSGKGIQHSVMQSDGNGWELIQVPSSGSRKPISAESIAAKENTFKMAGKSVFSFATDVIPRIISDLAERGGVKPEEIDHIIPHQANVRIIDFISKKTGIPKEKFLLNLDRYGNTAAGSVGLALDENRRNGVIKSGDLVLMMGFGGGLSWGGVLLRA
ncbi:ketoacyl-ACP synthase III [Geomonas nitrogeniifigens]|uniref:Beta-ketoacyl-[acyl-carrier-protein] synthase III n=1 Tax=Geomonas diazotrophica TaxID=2843197 RepID=A0ABX8JL06_9BACT|nr:beta-ketoacyl-ACP synthase III [Geomonas nitrogeniifigens]QWV97314.1 ketoacyl-ACP synthase III [Geomonas nitrogeniifigens]QXE86471.1 ketoacyl-ACP synthase III [Geomonas nitrogeniifigens]